MPESPSRRNRDAITQPWINLCLEHVYYQLPSSENSKMIRACDPYSTLTYVTSPNINLMLSWTAGGIEAYDKSDEPNYAGSIQLGHKGQCPLMVNQHLTISKLYQCIQNKEESRRPLIDRNDADACGFIYAIKK